MTGPGAESYATLQDLQATPDPARDARRRAYLDGERRKAARDLDRYIETVFTATDPQGVPTGNGPALAMLTAGERFVAAVGDYVLARLTGGPEGERESLIEQAYEDGSIFSDGGEPPC